MPWCMQCLQSAHSSSRPLGCSGCAMGSSAQGPRPPTQTRPLPSVSAPGCAICSRTAARAPHGRCSSRLRCHGRSANAEAVSAAISSRVTSSASACMWCTQCLQSAHSSSRPLVLGFVPWAAAHKDRGHRRRHDHCRRYRRSYRRGRAPSPPWQ